MIGYKPVRHPDAPMLSNGYRAQMGTPLVLLALKPALPVIGWIVGVGLAAVGISFAARNEAEKWKDASGLNLSNIPKAVLAGGAGAISLVVGGNLEGTSKVVASSLGIAGIAGAIYLMFSGEPKEAPAGDTAAAVPPGARVALAPATVENPAPVWQGDVLRVLTATMDPKQPNTNGDSRSIYFDQAYEAYVINESTRPISFYAGANIYESDAGVVFASDKLTPPYQRVVVNLGPKGSSTASAIVKVLTPTPSLWKGEDVKRSVFHATGVSIELFRQRDDPTPFYVTNSIPIAYSHIGLG